MQIHSLLPTYRPAQTLASILLAFTLGILALGCASVRPGHDPVVVNAERSMSIAFEVIDGFLRVEHKDRAYFREHAPNVHATAESLRKRAPEAFRHARQAVKNYKANRIGADWVRRAVSAVTALGLEASEALTKVQQ